MAKQVVSLQVDEKLKKKIDKFKDKQGVSFSQFIRDLIDFDPYFLEIIMGYAKRHELKPYLVIQNMLIKRFAQEAAENQFYGKPQPRDLIEFQHVEEGFLTGKALFIWLKKVLLDETNQKHRQQRFTKHNDDRALLI